MNIKAVFIVEMFPLPKPSVESLKKWQGCVLTKEPFKGFVVVWPAEVHEGKMTKAAMHPGLVFILRNGDMFTYAYFDCDGFQEVPEKWYAKCFQNLANIPQENLITVSLNGVFTEVPFLPTVLFQRKTSTKRRKKTHNIVHNVVYPTWKHQKGKSVHFQVAKQFKELFDRADNGEVELMDPFQGYTCLEEVKKSKSGRQALRTVAGFIYHQCRDNLGYPVSL